MLTWSTYIAGSYTIKYMRPKEARSTVLIFPGSRTDADLVEVNIFAREMFIRSYNVVLFDLTTPYSSADIPRLKSEYNQLILYNIIANLPIYTVGGSIAMMMAHELKNSSYKIGASAIITNSSMCVSTNLASESAAFDISIPLLWRYSVVDPDSNVADISNAMTSFKQRGGVSFESEASVKRATVGVFAKGLDIYKATEIYNYLVRFDYLNTDGTLSIEEFDEAEITQEIPITHDDVVVANAQVRILNAHHEFSAEIYVDIVSWFALYRTVVPVEPVQDTAPAYLVRNINNSLQVYNDNLVIEEVVGAEFYRHSGELVLSFNTGRELRIPGFPSLRSIGIGVPGDDGVDGLSGADGSDGERGISGAIGCAGRVGPTGPRGRQGAIGLRGPTGPIGPTGPRGMKGPTGIIGETGIPGIHQSVVQIDDPTSSVGSKGIWCQTEVSGYSYADVKSARGTD